MSASKESSRFASEDIQEAANVAVEARSHVHWLVDSHLLLMLFMTLT